MSNSKSLVFHSMAGDHCHQCGRPTRLRCVACNPMHYVCCQCFEDHAASHGQFSFPSRQPAARAPELAVAS